MSIKLNFEFPIIEIKKVLHESMIVQFKRGWVYTENLVFYDKDAFNKLLQIIESQ